jgi:L-lysine 2,3-aminomutase
MEYRQFNAVGFRLTAYYERLPKLEREIFDTLSSVFHFKVNNYVLEHLIDWDNIPNDPMYRLVFPRKEMLSESDFLELQTLSISNADLALKQFLFDGIRLKMFPQMKHSTDCIPTLNGDPVQGSYRSSEKLLFLFAKPMLGTCHAYCTYCFRWITFGESELQKAGYREPREPLPYLLSHPEITDVLFTGADPFTLKAETLKRYIEPILEVETVQVIRISSKSLAWWPFRFTTDADADDLLDLFSHIRSKGKHLSIYAHFTHDREMTHPEVAKAARRISSTGAGIRTQGPLVRGINDSVDTWARLWSKQIQLGMIPEYMYVEADHSPVSYFRVPLAESLRIFNRAQSICSGLVRTVRGPVFMNDIYRVLLDGVTEINGKKYFVLKSQHGPAGTHTVGDIKLVPYDEESKDVGNLYELFHSSPHTVSA